MSVSQKLWPSLPLQHRIRRMWWAYAVLALVAVVVSLWVSGEIGRHRAEAALEEQARMDARLNAALLRTVLEKYRALPFVLSQDTALAAALAGNDAGTFKQLSQKLEMLAAGTKAAVIYVIDKDGIAVSASNWREPTSFVGNDYRFREYFQGRPNEDRPSTSRSARSARNRVSISPSGFRAAMACWASLSSRSNSTTSRQIGTPRAPRPTSLTSAGLSSSPVFHHGGS